MNYKKKLKEAVELMTKIDNDTREEIPDYYWKNDNFALLMNFLKSIEDKL